MPQADLTQRARYRARNALADDPGELDEDWLTELLATFAQSEREATAATARGAAIVAEQIGAEIVSIMETYDQQEAERGYVDTPGGLEHMGDVWRLLGGWRDRLASPAPQEENGDGV